jgi:DNA-binding NarL/FixJ family response regulator
MGQDSVVDLVTVDQHPIWLFALREVFRSVQGLEVVGAATNPTDALAVVAQTLPRVLTMGLDYGAQTGFNLIRDLHVQFPEIRLLVVSAMPAASYAEQAIQLGAHGYVCKDATPDELVAAVRCLAGGKLYLSPEHFSDILNRHSLAGKAGGRLCVDRLSPAEFEVFHLIGAGNTTQQIARMLHRSAKTIETYRCRIEEKLGLLSGLELGQFAMR